MNSKVENNEQIDEIISQMQCKKGFQCSKPGFKALCEAKDIGLKDVVKCLNIPLGGCEYSFPFGDSYFCKCPLRVYLAKNLKK